MAIKYVQVEYDHLKSMSRGMALYFGYLKKLDDYFKGKPAYLKHGGWHLSTKKAEQDTGISQSSQKRYLKLLEDTGMVDIATGGFRNMRKIRVTYDEGGGPLLTVKLIYLPQFGVTDGVFLSYLEGINIGLSKKGRIKKDGFFFFYLPKAEENIGYPERLQREIMNKISKEGVLAIEESNIPKGVMLRIVNETKPLPKFSFTETRTFPIMESSMSFLCQGMPF